MAAVSGVGMKRRDMSPETHRYPVPREPDGMSPVATGSVFRQIESLFEGGSVAGLTDRQLLERFNARRDPTGEAAFAALVTRHGPMVLDVCRVAPG